MRKYVVASVIFLLVAGGVVGVYFYTKGGSSGVTFRTEAVKQGELVVTVNTTGTLEPEEVYDIGTQVAGIIKEFGKDGKGKDIDYKAEVEAGTVLVRIDDVIYKARLEQSKSLVRSAEQKVRQAEAGVLTAEASVLTAAANLRAATSRLAQSERTWNRVKGLDSVSAAESDTARFAYEIDKASVAQTEAAQRSADAAVANAKAAVDDAKAAVETAKAQALQDQTNLDYCTIRSPVKGTIIDRRVTLGQTVQPAFNTPSLFLLGKDLRRMEIWASVNESDIGRIKEGQSVRYTVDAYPNETFTGQVKLIRDNATNTNNVVQYTVEVSTENPHGKLKPYLTATMKFEIDRRENAILVPNAAIRYRPTSQVKYLDGYGPGTAPPPVPTPPKSGDGDAAPGEGKAKGSKRERQPAQAVVWVAEGGKLRSIPLTLGLTDGTMTEVLSGELTPNTAVVVGENRANTAPAEGSNPFAAPKFGGGKRQ